MGRSFLLSIPLVLVAATALGCASSDGDQPSPAVTECSGTLDLRGERDLCGRDFGAPATAKARIAVRAQAALELREWATRANDRAQRACAKLVTDLVDAGAIDRPQTVPSKNRCSDAASVVPPLAPRPRREEPSCNVQERPVCEGAAETWSLVTCRAPRVDASSALYVDPRQKAAAEVFERDLPELVAIYDEEATARSLMKTLDDTRSPSQTTGYPSTSCSMQITDAGALGEATHFVLTSDLETLFWDVFGSPNGRQ